ncbi:hypothetical protein QFC21_006813 [Naganishia friedmannii]|uniref:Uncharacterized protein n=1 Tax=Naganishia friedmannii TaxID=89922 RepID=A0ACC2V0R4_9TREE|nr:hypothetical protein QFC21_006813 [Naganishia friedmannii]
MPKAREAASTMLPSAAMRRAALNEVDVKPNIGALLPPPPPPPPLASTVADVKPTNMEIDELAEDNGRGSDVERARWTTVDEDEQPDVGEMKPGTASAPNVSRPHPALLPLVNQFEQAFAAQQSISANPTMGTLERRIQNAVIAAQQETTSQAMKVAIDKLGIRLPNIGLPLP